MHARSALFDLYGDHLRGRGDRAPIASLVRLLAPLDIAAPAVRTAVSRMVRQGWLEPVRLAAGPGYRLTDRARTRLDEAATRIYRTRTEPWDGCWDLLVLGPVAQRSSRERIRSGLAFLGYAPLSDSTWISPFPSEEVASVLAPEEADVHRFSARDADPTQRAQRAWDLDGMDAAYAAWLDFARGLVDGSSPPRDDEQAFAVRSVLVHEWRKFLFTDPGLPDELLPETWAGRAAGRFFAEEAARLLPAASRFVDACLSDPDQPTDQPTTDQPTTDQPGAAR